MLFTKMNILRSALQQRGFASLANGSFNIPVVDFNKFRRAASPNEKRKAAGEIVSAFKQSGFVYLSNHGIDLSQVQNTFKKSAEFFTLPTHLKDDLKWEDPRSNRGYVGMGRERLVLAQSTDPKEIASLRLTAPDHKESMEIGRERDSEWKNHWPSDSLVPGFKQRMLDFYENCHDLHVQVMCSIALGLDLPEDFFNDKIDEKCHNLRLLSYPPVKSSLLRMEGQARAGAHSDYGTITLLFQDPVGGLEVQDPHTGVFIPATPIDGAVVVNVGDLLARWSNDVLRSTLHRVVAPPAQMISNTEGMTPPRQSIVFFCSANGSTEVSCLPTCGDKAKYPPITAGNYIVERLAATYA